MDYMNREKLCFNKQMCVEEVLTKRFKEGDTIQKELIYKELKALEKVKDYCKEYLAYKNLERYVQEEKAFDKYELELEKFLIPHYAQIPELEAIKQQAKGTLEDDEFNLFCDARVRKGENTLNEKYTIKDFKKAYDRWAVSTSRKKIDIKDLERRCEQRFGNSKGKREYRHIRVFLEEEDVEEYDREVTQ